MPKYADFKEDSAAVEKHFDTLFATLKELRDYLANILYVLPTYTRKVFQKEVDSLHTELNKEKEKALPKSKFSFKIKSKKEKTKKAEEIKVIEEEEVDEFKFIDDTKDLVLKQIKNKKRIVLESEYEGKDKVYLINIENSDIYLPFIMKALYIKNVYNSRIYGGYVLGASFFDLTNKSTYHIWSHQVRIHKANNWDFFLHAKQGPIIEDWSGIRFGYHLFSYPNKGKQLKESGFDGIVNAYKKVSDFKWLKSEKSPNFSIISEEDLALMTVIVLEASDLS